MSIPPTIQIETDIDYNDWDAFEFLTFNYKGDVQYYSNEDLRNLTSGILPVVVYPSIDPYDTEDKWTPFFFTKKGTGEMPPIDPTKPYNDNICPEGWVDFSKLVNEALEEFDYKNHGKGSLLPQSDYIKKSIENHPEKTVSLFCALYTNEKPSNYILETNISDDLSFYVLNIQNGDENEEI